MNILDMFEERASAMFGESPSGQATPFSFKKLAKQAARAMEQETYAINNVDTAPALYTVLVSETDAQMIQPLYAQLTREASQFVKSQAKKQGYAFVGEPLFRFIPDPSLKSGKFVVFAENVDVHTLHKLREEEQSYMGGRNYAAQNFAEHEVGLKRIPDDFGVAASTAGANNMADLPVMPVIPKGPVPGASSASAPVVSSIPAVGGAVGSAVGSAATVGGDAFGARAVASAATAGVAASGVVANAISSEPTSCLLIERSTGRTYTATAPSSIIGRERTPHGIVLHDPNVSRRHAELSFDGVDWRIRDLNSTNGTLINDVDIDECILRNGDIITVGMCNLEFKGD